MKKFFCFLLALCIFFTTKNILLANDEIILFHSHTCGYCKEVFDEIEEKKLEEALDIKMVESGDDGASELFAQKQEECGLNPDRGGYPTLYHNGDCSVGSVNTIKTLSTLAGIETEAEEQQEEDASDRTLQDVAFLEPEKIEKKPRPFSHYIVMILGPIGLISLGYFMIKKLNL